MTYKDLCPDFVDDESGRPACFELSEKALEKEAKKSIQVALYVIKGPWMGTYCKVWKSNLQKCIRRQKVFDAVVSMVAVGECGGQYLSNMMNRLCKVIISEDIGVADFCLLKECKKMIELYESDRKNFMSRNRNDVLRLVARVAACPKSRAVDNLIHANGEFEEVSVDHHRVKFVKAVQKNDLMKMVKHCIALNRLGGVGNVSIGKSLPGFASVIAKKKKSIYWVWLVLLDEVQKLINKRSVAKKNGEDLYSDVFGLQEIVEDLCSVYGIHSGHGNLLNIVHAILVISLYKDGMLPKIDTSYQEYQPLEVRTGECKLVDMYYEWDTILKLGMDGCKVFPLSASYDRHVGLNLPEERKGLDFFLKEGAEIVDVPDWLVGLETHFKMTVLGVKGCE
jgi:hypothetical protein